MKVVLFVLAMLSAIGGYAQQAATDPAMMKFFVGNWGCAGEFASSKKEDNFGNARLFTSIVYMRK